MYLCIFLQTYKMYIYIFIIIICMPVHQFVWWCLVRSSDMNQFLSCLLLVSTDWTNGLGFLLLTMILNTLKLKKDEGCRMKVRGKGPSHFEPQSHWKFLRKVNLSTKQSWSLSQTGQSMSACTRTHTYSHTLCIYESPITAVWCRAPGVCQDKRVAPEGKWIGWPTSGSSQEVKSKKEGKQQQWHNVLLYH